jgi:hypothetical protein
VDVRELKAVAEKAAKLLVPAAAAASVANERAEHTHDLLFPNHRAKLSEERGADGFALPLRGIVATAEATAEAAKNAALGYGALAEVTAVVVAEAKKALAKKTHHREMKKREKREKASAAASAVTEAEASAAPSAAASAKRDEHDAEAEAADGFATSSEDDEEAPPPLPAWEKEDGDFSGTL